MKNIITQQARSGCIDIWNAFMVKDAIMTPNDIPVCPTTAMRMPTELITYDVARSLVKKEIQSGNTDFKSSAFVCCYIDDYKFDNSEGIWQKPYKAVEILKHFAGIITPDWSTYADFPYPLKLFNVYRMRAFGYWYGTHLGYEVINNVRWGTSETYSYCFDGIPPKSPVAIGTIASDLKNPYNFQMFMDGLDELLARINPPAIIIYGSLPAKINEYLEANNVNVIVIPSAHSYGR